MYPIVMSVETSQLTVPQVITLMRELGVNERATVQNMAALTKAVDSCRLTVEEWSLLSQELDEEQLSDEGLAIFGKAFSKAALNIDEKDDLSELFAREEEAA